MTTPLTIAQLRAAHAVGAEIRALTRTEELIAEIRAVGDEVIPVTCIVRSEKGTLTERRPAMLVWFSGRQQRAWYFVRGDAAPPGGFELLGSVWILGTMGLLEEPAARFCAGDGTVPWYYETTRIEDAPA